MLIKSIKILKITKAVQAEGRGLLVIAIFIAIFCLPIISSWAYYQMSEPSYLEKIQFQIRSAQRPVPKIMKVYVSAYSSTPEQTDSTPCITASGYDLCAHDQENVVACNFLPMGTKIIFPELNPDKIYTVVDRMHERFDSRIDVWKRSKADAKKFGLKRLLVEIYP